MVYGPYDSPPGPAQIMASVSGLLTLLGIDPDPVASKEHIFLSSLMSDAWSRGETLELADLVHAIAKPPFSRVGVMDLESFYPEAERQKLAMRVNGVLASPGFGAWLEGEPLDVVPLTEDGTGAWIPDVETFRGPVYELAYVLRAYGNDGNFDETEPQPLWMINGEPVKATIQDPCRLSRHMEKADAIRGAVAKSDSIEVKEMMRHGVSANCCGSLQRLRSASSLTYLIW